MQSGTEARNRWLTAFRQPQDTPNLAVFDLVGPPAVTLGVACGYVARSGKPHLLTKAAEQTFDRVHLSAHRGSKLRFGYAPLAAHAPAVIARRLADAEEGDGLVLLLPLTDEVVKALRHLDVRPQFAFLEGAAR